MTLADSLKQTVFNARGVAGTLGFRQYRVFRLYDYYELDSSYAGPSKQEIVEGSNQPPRVTTETFQDLPPGSKSPDVRMVGPITPAFPGGGTDLSDWIADIEDNATRHLLLVGPDCLEGKRYRVLHISTDKALRYMVRVQSEAELLAGMAGAFG